MKKNFQKYLLLSFFCLGIIIFIIILGTGKKAQIKRALDRVENYYQNSEPSTRFDNQTLQLWLGFGDIEELKQKSKEDPLIRLLDIELIHQESAHHTIINYRDDGSITEFSTKKLDDFMIRALYCDVNGFNQNDYYLFSKLRDHSAGYRDTHFLIYNLILQKLGCFDQNILEAHERAVVETILRVQNNDTNFSDLYVERIVVLAWAGRSEMIQESWIKTILEAQNQQGSWVESNISYSEELMRKERIRHATGLAALSLKYYLDKEVVGIRFAQ